MFKPVKSINAACVAGHKNLAPVLLQTGRQDEAIRYFAQATAHGISSGEFLVYVGESSLLLDLVRLKRKIVIEVAFGFNCYNAELSLTKVPSLLSTQCALALTLISPCENLFLDDEKYCPIT